MRFFPSLSGAMCNHYRAINSATLEIAEYWSEINEGVARTFSREAWPKAEMPVVFQAEKRTLGFMRWGVWPWYEKAMPARPVVNARDDGLLTKSIWKKLTATGRCLVPADGFFEWCGPAGAKWEVLFETKDRRPFFFAGLWSRDPAGAGRGFTIVTGRPNELVAALPHDRMPVILEDDRARAWLGDGPLPDEQVMELCSPFPADQLIRTDMVKPDRKAPSKIVVEKVEPPDELFSL